ILWSQGKRRQSDGGLRKWKHLCPSQGGKPVNGLRIDYEYFEQAIVDFILKLEPADVTSRLTNGAAARRDTEAAKLAARLPEIKREQKQFMDRWDRTKDEIWLDKIEQLTKEKDRVSSRLAELEQDNTSTA